MTTTDSVFDAFQYLVRHSRSVRRFDATFRIPRETLVALVSLARYCPSGQNRQPLRFFLSAEPETNDTIFPHLRWAGHLRDWAGPAVSERPTAYLLVLHDHTVAADPGQDPGIVAQTLLLGAATLGLGGCMIGSMSRSALHTALALPDTLEIRLCIALGKPAEEIQIDDVGPDGDTRYFRDADGVHHVPKRRLESLILA